MFLFSKALMALQIIGGDHIGTQPQPVGAETGKF
jgi:hypothetical protein